MSHVVVGVCIDVIMTFVLIFFLSPFFPLSLSPLPFSLIFFLTFSYILPSSRFLSLSLFLFMNDRKVGDGHREKRKERRQRNCERIEREAAGDRYGERERKERE